MSQVASSNILERLDSTKPQKAPPRFPCSRCDKVFKRSEHRTRHERGHTKEKPFHCKYCGRKYARKDLVNRHEKSFHPNADGILSLERANAISELSDVTMSETRNLPTPPSYASEHILEYTHSQSRSPQNEEYNVMVPAGTRSPPLSDSMPVETRPYESCSDTVHLDHPMAQILAPSSEKDEHTSRPLSSNGQNFSAGDGYSPHGSHFSSASRDVSNVDTWNASSMTCSLPNFEDWLRPASAHVNQNMGPDEFDLITIDSMALNNAALSADLSTYLHHSVPFSWDELGHNSAQDNQSIGTHVAIPESPSLPIEASALNVGMASPMNDGILSRMPSLLKETPRNIMASPIVDADIYYTIMAGLRTHTSVNADIEPLLSLQEMQQFLKCYLVCFHRHCPIIHLPSLDLKKTPCHLILVMCAIGALYRLRRKTAHDLWDCASQICEKELETNRNSDSPVEGVTIATMQCKLLVAWFSLFSGDMTQQSISASGFWSTEYRSRRVLLASTPYDSANATWEQWILRETSKRLLYGIFIMSSMASLAYDLTPMFSITQDLDIELLDEEKLWEAGSSQEWDALRKPREGHSSVTIRHAFTHLVLGKEDQYSAASTLPMRWTAFSTSFIMHAVNIYMWNLMQCTQSFNVFAVEDSTSASLQTSLVNQTEAALARCYALLTADRPERERTSDDPEGPLLFNCLALLRSAHIRVFTGADNFNRLTLLCGSPQHVSASIDAFISGNGLQRGPLLTRAADKAYGGFLTPIKAGYLLVRKTAALTWSLEHPIAAWDCALLATKWVHTLEMAQLESPPNQDELVIIANFRTLLSEADSEYDGYGSLAGEIMRVWASLFDDTWTWGITPRMGRVMRRLSAAFKQDWKRRFPEGNPGGPISQ